MAVSTIPAVVATPRTGKFNKNAARRVRVSGQIPAVVYGAGIEPVAVAVDPKVITRILHSDSGNNTIFDLDVPGAGPAKAIATIPDDAWGEIDYKPDGGTGISANGRASSGLGRSGRSRSSSC